LKKQALQASVSLYCKYIPRMLSTRLSLLAAFVQSIRRSHERGNCGVAILRHNVCECIKTFCFCRELRSVAGCNIMNLTMALFSALLAFLVGANQTESSDTCTAISILLHYLFLTTAFWNNVIAYDVWKTFGQGGGAFVFCRNGFSRKQLTVCSWCNLDEDMPSQKLCLTA